MYLMTFYSTEQFLKSARIEMKQASIINNNTDEEAMMLKRQPVDD